MGIWLDIISIYSHALNTIESLNFLGATSFNLNLLIFVEMLSSCVASVSTEQRRLFMIRWKYHCLGLGIHENTSPKNNDFPFIIDLLKFGLSHTQLIYISNMPLMTVVLHLTHKKTAFHFFNTTFLNLKL